jgi:hypothetical protein
VESPKKVEQPKVVEQPLPIKQPTPLPLKPVEVNPVVAEKKFQPEVPLYNISSTLPPVGKMGNGYDLPAIGSRRGMGF